MTVFFLPSRFKDDIICNLNASLFPNAFTNPDVSAAPAQSHLSMMIELDVMCIFIPAKCQMVPLVCFFMYMINSMEI